LKIEESVVTVAHEADALFVAEANCTSILVMAPSLSEAQRVLSIHEATCVVHGSGDVGDPPCRLGSVIRYESSNRVLTYDGVDEIAEQFVNQPVGGPEIL